MARAPKKISIPYVRLLESGRQLFFSGEGKFISKATYDRLNARSVKKGTRGRFLSKDEARRRGTLSAQESRLRQQFGKPPRGWNWITIANEYPDRFANYL